MRGEFIVVWSELAREVWMPLGLDFDEQSPAHASLLSGLEFPEKYDGHDDLYAGLFREAFLAIKDSLKSPKYGSAPSEVLHPGIDLAELTSDPRSAYEALLQLDSAAIKSERDAVEFLERAHDVCAEYEDVLAARYRTLLEAFVSKYSLRYEIAEPCILHPTLPGAFASLFQELETFADADPALIPALGEFKIAYRDIRRDPTEARIKTCIQKLVLLIEGIALRHTNARGNAKTLGEACNVLRTWPHATIRKALSSLYGFSSDYPGIRHAGNHDAMERALDQRDLVAICVIMAGYVPYLLDGVDCGGMYMSAFVEEEQGSSTEVTT